MCSGWVSEYDPLAKFGNNTRELASGAREPAYALTNAYPAPSLIGSGPTRGTGG
jgi:hypothetical protein